MDNTSYGRQILFVEDDRAARQEVRQFLEHNGYTVIAAERGQQAIDIITRVLPDLALVDYYLPDMNGFEVCKAIRRYAEVPIILLTKENEEETKVMALEQYAEDYITKPFGMRELEARISRVLKRFTGPADESYAEMIVDDHLHVNFSRHWVDVRKPGETNYKREQLTPIESRIMHILIRNAGRVMTTEALLARVWAGDDEAYPEGLRVHIRRLRVKIEPHPETPKYIITERGLGYRFAVPVKQGLTNATE
ncbi:MAG TPA: response regulator transcription factor [Ktedonobacterales bacterium]|nr:response regulator transcription factor [Ktedonobacterales bacterium]